MRSKAKKCSSGRRKRKDRGKREIHKSVPWISDLTSFIHLAFLRWFAELVGFETKAARGGGMKRRKTEMETETDRESHNHSAQLMNVRRRVADPPQGAALITDGAWLGVVIESNDN